MKRYLVHYTDVDKGVFSEFYLWSKTLKHAKQQANDIITKHLEEEDLRFDIDIEHTRTSTETVVRNTSTHQGRVAAFNDARQEGIAFGKKMLRSDSFLSNQSLTRFLFKNRKEAIEMVGDYANDFRDIYGRLENNTRIIEEQSRHLKAKDEIISLKDKEISYHNSDLKESRVITFVTTSSFWLVATMALIVTK